MTPWSRSNFVIARIFVLPRRSSPMAHLPGRSLNHRRKVVSFRGSFPRNPVGGRTFELDRRDSLGCGRKPALKSVATRKNLMPLFHRAFRRETELPPALSKRIAAVL